MPRVPFAQRAGERDAAEVLWWVSSCFGGATAGASVAFMGAAYFYAEYSVSWVALLVWVCISGMLGGVAAMASAAPLLMFVNRKRVRLLATALVAFALTVGLLALLLINVSPPPRS